MTLMPFWFGIFWCIFYDSPLRKIDILADFQAKIKEDDAKKVAVEVDEGVPRPTPRCNFSVNVIHCAHILNEVSSTKHTHCNASAYFKSSKRNGIDFFWWRILQWRQGPFLLSICNFLVSTDLKSSLTSDLRLW